MSSKAGSIRPQGASSQYPRGVSNANTTIINPVQAVYNCKDPQLATGSPYKTDYQMQRNSSTNLKQSMMNPILNQQRHSSPPRTADANNNKRKKMRNQQVEFANNKFNETVVNHFPDYMSPHQGEKLMNSDADVIIMKDGFSRSVLDTQARTVDSSAHYNDAKTKTNDSTIGPKSASRFQKRIAASNGFITRSPVQESLESVKPVLQSHNNTPHQSIVNNVNQRNRQSYLKSVDSCKSKTSKMSNKVNYPSRAPLFLKGQDPFKAKPEVAQKCHAFFTYSQPVEINNSGGSVLVRDIVERQHQLHKLNDSLATTNTITSQKFAGRRKSHQNKTSTQQKLNLSPDGNNRGREGGIDESGFNNIVSRTPNNAINSSRKRTKHKKTDSMRIQGDDEPLCGSPESEVQKQATFGEEQAINFLETGKTLSFEEGGKNQGQIQKTEGEPQMVREEDYAQRSTSYNQSSQQRNMDFYNSTDSAQVWQVRQDRKALQKNVQNLQTRIGLLLTEQSRTEHRIEQVRKRAINILSQRSEQLNYRRSLESVRANHLNNKKLLNWQRNGQHQDYDSTVISGSVIFPRRAQNLCLMNRAQETQSMRAILFYEQNMAKKNDKRILKQRQARAADIDQLPSQIREAYRNLQNSNRAFASDQLQQQLKEEFSLIQDNVYQVQKLERKEAKILQLLTQAHQQQEQVFDHVRRILYDDQGGDTQGIDACAQYDMTNEDGSVLSNPKKPFRQDSLDSKSQQRGKKHRRLQEECDINAKAEKTQNNWNPTSSKESQDQQQRTLEVGLQQTSNPVQV